MASTIQLQRTILIGQQFLRLAPLTFATNTNNDPAFFCADWVKQMILAPPFAWRWNRTEATVDSPTFTTIQGQTDYKVSLPDFGWIERAVAYDPNNANSSYELILENNKAVDTLNNQPQRISAQFDDDAGNITFRIFPAPDSVYAVVVSYQKSATLFAATSQTWTPIPDYLSYLYTTGFQAKVYEYANDPRWAPTTQLFLQQLVSASEGLSETEKNIWLEDKMRSVRQQLAVQNGRPV